MHVKGQKWNTQGPAQTEMREGRPRLRAFRFLCVFWNRCCFISRREATTAPLLSKGRAWIPHVPGL
jgi:hypothetical protein